MRNAIVIVMALGTIVLLAIYLPSAENSNEPNNVEPASQPTKYDTSPKETIINKDVTLTNETDNLRIPVALPKEVDIALEEQNAKKAQEVKVKIDTLIQEMNQNLSDVEERARIKNEMQHLIEQYNQLMLPTTLKEIEKANQQ